MALLLNLNTTNSSNTLSDGTLGAPTTTRGMVDSTLGALLIGTLIGLMLYGFSVHQAYRCQRLRADWRSRTLVSAIIVLETAHSVSYMHLSYFYLVTSKSSALRSDVQRSVWSANILGIFSGLIFSLCQSFLAWRVHKLWPRHGLRVVVAAALLTLGQFAMTIAATVLLFMRTPDQHTSTIQALNGTHSGMVVAANIILTVSLIYRLRRSRTGFCRTDSIIDIIIVYTVNTGFLIGISTLAAFIFALAWPKSQVGAAVDMVATKIYAITLLAEMNSRENVLQALENKRGIMVSPTNCDYAHSIQQANYRRTRTTSPICINVQTEMIMTEDVHNLEKCFSTEMPIVKTCH
ncbi:hypothetical protein C8Q74DRAFT_121884 [Fomes fomentarius]|nr:hypothetical protein C8Q74DRAFT_121884 [Fomes fomentarius]